MARYADDFMGWVELHEHAWGSENYPNRPHLKTILDSPVVTFWRPLKRDKNLRYIIRLYRDLKELEVYYTRLVLRANIDTPQDRVSRIFVERKRFIVAGVSMKFREVQPDK